MNEWGSDVLHTFVGDTEALRHWIRFHQTFANKPLCRYKDTASNPQWVDLAALRSHAPGSRRYRYDFFKNPYLPREVFVSSVGSLLLCTKHKTLGIQIDMLADPPDVGYLSHS
jgi:hypothetical protein